MRSTHNTAEPTRRLADGHWLIFADRRGVGHGAFANRLAAVLGARATLVEQGSELRQREDGNFELPIDDAPAADELIGILEDRWRAPDAASYFSGRSMRVPPR